MTFLKSAVLFIGAVLVCSCTKEEAQRTDTPSAVSRQSSAESASFASFEFAAEDTYGQIRQSREWIGKQPVVVNFWGTWCPPCRREIPDLVKVYNEYKDKGVEIISLALNDTPDKVNAYASQNDMQWVQLMGNEDAVKQFGTINAVPTTIFISRDGREIRRLIGMQNYEEFKSAFEEVSKT